MSSESSDRAERLEKIATILVEENVASYLPFELGVSLETESDVIELVRSSPNGAEDLPGFMLGVAPRAAPENLARAAQRIIDEVH